MQKLNIEKITKKGKVKGNFQKSNSINHYCFVPQIKNTNTNFLLLISDELISLIV